MAFRTLLSLIAGISLMSVAFAESSLPILRPDLVIQQASDDLLAAIDARRQELAENPQALYSIIDAALLRHFDTRYAARLVLPRNWTSITSEQRQQFLDALSGSLVRRYAIGALKHHETRIRMIPFRLKLMKPGEEQFATVKTMVTLDSGIEVPVDYAMRWSESQWKIYDVKIEGRSYVLYYRGVIARQLKEQDIDAVIQDLNTP